MAPRDLVSVGVITGAHGIRGEVKLRSFTATPDALVRYAPLKTATGGTVEIAKLRPQKDGFIAVLKGVTDRNAAEALKGTALFVPRDRLPAPDAGEVYVADLIGRRVVLADGTALGQIVDVANYGAGDLIDVKVEGRRDTVLIPFASGFVQESDGADIVVDLPEGFLDDAKEE
jgi:16S rRNA processing protein RimM